jgi:hypothetical protein
MTKSEMVRKKKAGDKKRADRKGATTFGPPCKLIWCCEDSLSIAIVNSPLGRSREILRENVAGVSF